jgi:hypothetical protein
MIYQTGSGLVGSSGLNLTAKGTLQQNALGIQLLENSLGAQPTLSNLMTLAFTTILHGHHLLNS